MSPGLTFGLGSPIGPVRGDREPSAPPQPTPGLSIMGGQRLGRRITPHPKSVRVALATNAVTTTKTVAAAAK